jgi:NADPH2:quinone reductase
MRAWRLHETGEPLARLVIDEIPEPALRPGCVAVRLDAVGLSFPDVLQCRGAYQVPTRIPFTPGGESAGVITAVADDVGDRQVGERVVMLGGGLQEQVVVAAGSVWPLPEGFSTTKAAAMPVNYGTTWYALHERAHLASGETLLVTGAAGGVGSAAIQLGRAAGARVIAVAGGAEKVARCRELGADEVIDHQEIPDFVDRVRELTGGAGVDVAYESVGGETTQRVRRCMAWDGRFLVIGFVGGIPEIPTNHILLKNYSVVGVHWGASLGRDPSSLDRQMRAILARAGPGGAVDPLVYPPYPFAAGAQALQDLADRATWGKVVVSVSPEG